MMNVDDDTFAPVVAWSTVRFFLVLAMTLGWSTASIDWANVFIQAVSKMHIYMNTPRISLNKFGTSGC